ncbi:PLDc N-terminal domain-containing protein [Nocardioides sp. R1-1]|uniref:PLDc N-terminal domain-containing protein n=1 Tax=Nocardioides sp. R1-1 TaxID=3383502 RepID=UPI0038D09AD5
MFAEWLGVLGINYALSLLAVIDMFRFRPATWHRAGQNRALWIALSLLLPPLGGLLYLTGPRLRLRQAVRAMRTAVASGTDDSASRATRAAAP